MENLTLEDFSQHMNSKFMIGVEGADAIGLELVEAEDIGSTLQHEQFSIVFRGPNDRLLPQGIYSVEHNELEKFDLFIVPIRQDQNGIYYEAIFNRPRLP
jgi:hypothetical protein